MSSCTSLTHRSRSAVRTFCTALCFGFVAGCSSIATLAPEHTIYDQHYRGRGASEAFLGSWGVKDRVGLHSFERMGYDSEMLEHIKIYKRGVVRTEMSFSFKTNGLAIVLKGAPGFDASASETVELLLVDLDRDDMMAALNARPELLSRLRSDRDARVITAVAILLRPRSTDGSLTLETGGMLPEISGLELDLEGKSVSTVSAGTIYGYQMAHIGWDAEMSMMSIGYPSNRMCLRILLGQVDMLW